MNRTVIILICLFLISCSSYDNMYQEIFQHYYNHNYKQAKKVANEYLEDMSRSDSDRPLLLLEKASACIADNAPEEAIAALREADEMSVVLDLTANPAVVGKYLFTDSAGMYRLQPHEQIQINTFNIISYLQSGNIIGANVEVKRAKVQEKYWVDQKRQTYAKNALLQLLGGVIAWHLSNLSDYNYFKRQFEGMVGNRAAYEFFSKNPQKNEKDVIVMVFNGRGPIKKGVKQRVYGTGVARIISGTGFKGDYIIYPKLVKRRNHFYNFSLMKEYNNLGYFYDLLNIENQAITYFETQRNEIMIAAATRLATRAAISSGAAIATREMLKNRQEKRKKRRKRKDEYGNYRRDNDDALADALGMLVGTIVQATMEAVDTPDTRCWTLLPKNILVKRLVGDFGDKITLGLNIGGANNIYKEFELDSKLNIALFVVYQQQIDKQDNHIDKQVSNYK